MNAKGELEMYLVYLLLLTVLLELNSTYCLLYKGKCPKIESANISSGIAAYSILYEVPFEIYQQKQQFFPTKSYRTFNIGRFNNIFWIRPDSCRRSVSFQRNNRTLELEFILTDADQNPFCKFKSDVEVAIRIQHDLAVVWGCVEINATFHEEALWIALNIFNLYTLADHMNTINWIKSYALMMLENKSRISDVQITEVISRYNEHTQNEIICEQYQCEDEVKAQIVGVAKPEETVVDVYILISIVIFVMAAIVFNLTKAIHSYLYDKRSIGTN